MFKNPAAEFVYCRTYARWNPDFNRRETWPETVERVVDFLRISRSREKQVPEKVFRKLKGYMLSLDVLPSMRLVWSAGSAADRDNICMYNCSFIPMDTVESFAECLYILMCGTGVGFSVEKKYTDKLPVVTALDPTIPPTIFYVPDDKAGWADSIKVLMNNLYEGKMLEFDYSLLRPKGAKLTTMGGRSSGPEPLIILHAFVKEIFSNAQGRKLTPLECHDICNQIAEVIVSGGVRRSSQVSLSDLADEEMRFAKVWPFPARRAMANNSAVYLSKPSAVEFLKEWASLASSGTGERGILNLESARHRSPKRRDGTLIMGSNPCNEILLRSLEFCNLSTIIVRPEDDLDSLLDKVETAAWVGTIQASFTDFQYLRPEWKKNCEEEALLGISISGQADNPSILTAEALKAMKSRAINVNLKASKALGINQAAAITCVKPEGTTSQLTTSGSGVHPWYSPFFIRRYRISGTDPLYRMLKDQGVPMTPENGQSESNATTWVVPFPMKAPKKAIFRNNVTALSQLEWYKKIQVNWCEHNCSITVYVKDHEWFEVGNWVYENWDIVGGVSFLPYDGGHYKQAPYEEITEDEYKNMLAKFPKIDYTILTKYEQDDQTEGSKTLACVGDKCELI